MHPQANVARKYALTKVRSGDYLLPDNDGRTVWRVMRYVDGPSSGLELPRDREFWGFWKWTAEPGAFVDVEDWDRWEMQGQMYDSRQEAIEAALRGIAFPAETADRTADD